MTRYISPEGQRRMNLLRMADTILAGADIDWFGRPVSESAKLRNEAYLQGQFEKRMQRGAYSANQSRRR